MLVIVPFLQEILLLLLRIIYACLSGLPIGKIDMPLVCNALVPYFMHEATIVQVSARNAAQFLIPILEESKKQYFILSSRNIRDFVNASGKDMPVINSLKLLLAYGQFATNSKLFWREGIFEYLLSIMFGQSREDEKIMAVSVVKIMSLQYQELQAEHGNPKPNVDVKISATNSEIVADPKSEGLTKMSAMIDQGVIETIDIPHAVCQLDDQAKSFAAACSKINHSRLKGIFDSFSLSLKSLKKKCLITSHDPILYGIILSSNVSNIMLNATMNLLEGK